MDPMQEVEFMGLLLHLDFKNFMNSIFSKLSFHILIFIPTSFIYILHIQSCAFESIEYEKSTKIFDILLGYHRVWQKQQTIVFINYFLKLPKLLFLFLLYVQTQISIITMRLFGTAILYTLDFFGILNTIIVIPIYSIILL